MRLLETAKNIYLGHFGESYQLVKKIQTWIDFVEEKLSEM
jgi:hypothetical protein